MGWVSAVAGIGSAIIGAKSAKDSSNKAAKQSMAGFNYLKGNEGVREAQTQGRQAQDYLGALLGLNPEDEALAEEAFGAYRDSTGYDFRFGEGQRGITSSAAARGLLNSGATARALTEYGQDFATSEYQRYLSMLQGQQQTGLGAAYNTASQGTSGGASAAGHTMTGAQRATDNIASGLGMAAGGIADVYRDRFQGGL